MVMFMHHTNGAGLQAMLSSVGATFTRGWNGHHGRYRPNEVEVMKVIGNRKPPIYCCIAVDLKGTLIGSSWAYGSLAVEFDYSDSNGWVTYALGDTGMGSQFKHMPLRVNGSIDQARLQEEVMSNIYAAGRGGTKQYVEAHYWGESMPQIKCIRVAENAGGEELWAALLAQREGHKVLFERAKRVDLFTNLVEWVELEEIEIKALINSCL